MTRPDLGTEFAPLRVELGEHEVLTVRQATQDDVAGIMALWESLSTEDTHRRFFAMVRATDAFVRRSVERCRDDGFGLVAVLNDGEPGQRIVADGGYVLLPNGDGEFALTVAPDRRGWLGPYLLDVLVGAAAERSVPNLEADILTENRRMLVLVRRRGYVTDGDTDYSIVHVVIGTEGRGPVWPPAPRGPKLLVEHPGGRWEGREHAAAAGFDVMVCGFRDRCPALEGRPCPLADEADAIIVAFPPGDARAKRLLRAHRRVHDAVPVVIAAPPGAGHDRADCRLASGHASAALRAQLAAVLGDA